MLLVSPQPLSKLQRCTYCISVHLHHLINLVSYHIRKLPPSDANLMQVIPNLTLQCLHSPPFTHMYSSSLGFPMSPRCGKPNRQSAMHFSKQYTLVPKPWPLASAKCILFGILTFPWCYPVLSHVIFLELVIGIGISLSLPPLPAISSFSIRLQMFL